MTAAEPHPLTRENIARLVRQALAHGSGVAVDADDAPPFPDGLDSLRITRIATQLSARIGIHIPLRPFFESRTVRELVGAIDTLATGAGRPGTTRQRLDETTRRSHRRLSYSQERMAFMQQLSVGSAAYHVVFGLRLHGTIDTAALGRALDSLPRRFDLLRTRFVTSAEGTVPLVMKTASLPLRTITADSALEVATEFSNAPFDLEKGNTARAALIRDGVATALLVLVFPHICIDQWSWELLLEQLAHAYATETGHAPEVAPGESGNYAAYALWHRSWFREHAFRTERDYWVRQLAGAERVSFEPDRPRPAVVSYRGARRRLAIAEGDWQQLEAVAQRQGATLAMLLFAALALLLRNHSGHDDLVIGLPVANRNHAGSLDCFGSLLNTLALRIRLHGDRGFAQLLHAVREQFLDAFDHQDMPFDVLVGQLHLERDPGQTPLFGVMLNVLNTPPAKSDLPGLRVERTEIDRRGAQFDLTLTVDRLHTKSVWFEYATDLYEAATIDRIVARYAALLESIVEDPGRRLDQMPQRARAEAAEIRRWREGPPPLPADTGLLDLLASGAAGNGDRIAVQCGDDTLDYRALWRRAERLASSLRSLNAVHGGRIGLLLGRTTDLPVVLLGAMLAPVTFVPMDPAFPDDRLAFIAADAGLHLILVESTDVAPAWLPAGAILQSVEQLIADGSEGTDRPAPSSGRATYVLYTSGSTGQPKGVEIPERALANFLHAMQARPGISPADRLLAVTTLNFDISLLELLLPLTVGARIVIASRDDARDGHRLAGLIAAQRITLMQATPSTWIQLLEAGWAGSTALRALVGGEALPPDLAARLHPRVLELWNMYGPTETTVWSSCCRVEDPVAGITIGTPIAGTTIEIVDRSDRPVGIGVAGEIVIGGVGLALRYLNQPELTAERFPTLPLDGEAARYYRTGDRGFWSGNGSLRIQGRLDRQVKLRGYRIEPGEIERCALLIPGVLQAQVTTAAGPSGDLRLALHLVPAGNAQLDPADVRSQLRRWLPDYMTPQVIAVIDRMPLLPNGKVNLRRLAQLAPSVTVAEPALPPQSHEEVILQGVWQELLGLSHVDRDQDFFALGGHSLLAMRLVTRIREELQRHCTLNQVFQHPTIAALSDALAGAAPLTDRTLVALQPEGEGPALFCICGVQLYRPLVAALDLDTPVFATYVPTTGEPEVRALAAEYLSTIRDHQPHGPYRLLGFSLGGVLAFEMAQQLRAAGERVEQLVLLDSDVPGEESRLAPKAVLQLLRKAVGGNESAAPMPDYLRAIRAYRPDPWPGTAVFIEATRADHFRPGYGWEDLVAGLQVIRIDSDHLELMHSQRAATLAQALRPVLAAPRPDSSSGA